MNEEKNIQNSKSFLSALNKMNSFFKTNTNFKKPSKQKEFHSKLINQTEGSDKNIKKKEQYSEYNLIYQTTNNNTDVDNQNSSTKNKHNNLIHKRSLSKNIFNNININNYNTTKKINIMTTDKIRNNSKDKNNQILFNNKGKGIVLNKVNIFKNVKFRKPSLNKNINKGNIIEQKINSNNSNSNVNTIVQSVSSLNMTSTDITTSTKRIKENNSFNKENKLIKEKENNKESTIFRNNNHLTKNNLIKESNTIIFRKNNKHNINRHLLNISSMNSNNPSISNINNNNNINTIYQFYKGILPNSNNLLNKTKKPKNINSSIKKSKKLNNSQKSKNFKKKRCSSQCNFHDISKKVLKQKKNLSLNTISNNISKKDDGGTIISDDSVFNISKRRSSSGTHNDSSKVSKGSGTISFDKKSKSISIDYTYSDDEAQTNRRKKGNQIQIDNENNKNLNKKIYLKDNDVNIYNNEFKNFCDDLSSKLFGNNI